MGHLGIDGEWLQDIAFKLAFTALLTFFVGSLITLVLSPDYSVFTQYISALALSEYGNIFNISVMITGTLLFPVFIVIYPILVNNAQTSTLWIKISIYSGMVAMINLVFVGGFPLTFAENPHLIVAALFFVMLMLHILFMTLIVHRTANRMLYEHLHTPYFISLGYVTVGLIVTMFVVILAVPFSVFAVLAQKLIVVLAFVYIVTLVRKMQICHQELDSKMVTSPSYPYNPTI